MSASAPWSAVSNRSDSEEDSPAFAGSKTNTPMENSIR